MSSSPKHHLTQQLLADGDESVRMEIDELEQTIQVKIALIAGMKEK